MEFLIHEGKSSLILERSFLGSNNCAKAGEGGIHEIKNAFFIYLNKIADGILFPRQLPL